MKYQRLRREIRILCSAIFDWRSCLLSKLVLALGVSYLFVPIDLIPDRIPIVGHLDELSFLAFGFVASRRFVPDAIVDQFALADAAPASPGRWHDLVFAVRVLRADFANFFLLQYRGVDGFLITGKNSGTHWLKFMLSCALAEQFGVAPPPRSSGRAADDIISHPRWPRRYRQLPRLGSSHTIPSIAFSWAWLAWLLRHPPVVVLVRDIDAAMRSNYVKWRHRYGASSAVYVRGDPSGRRFIADVWWYIHFFNRWGDLAQARPGTILVLRYEDLQKAPDVWLQRIAAHYRIRLDERALAAALRYVDRDAIRAQLDPTDTEIVVPDDGVKQGVFTAADEAFIRNAVARYLRHDFGYGYGARPQLLHLSRSTGEVATRRVAGEGQATP